MTGRTVTGRTLAAAAVAASATLTLGGCGLARPASRPASRPTVAASPPPRASVAAGVAQAQRTHEYRTPVPHPAVPDPAVPGGWRTPVQAVEVFTATYVNWSAQTVITQLRELASVSLGQARAAMTQAATETGRDVELRRGGIANSGTIEAIAPVTGHPRQYAVVTRERTSATHDGAYRGLAPAWHVSVATVTRMSDGLWVLSGWQPEN